MTLRTRLIAILAALVALGLLVSGSITYGALRTFLFNRVDEQLEPTLSVAGGELRGSMLGEIPEPHGTLPIAAYAELRGPAGEVINRIAFDVERGESIHLPNIPDDVAEREPFTTGSTADSAYRFRAIATPTADGGRLIVAIPLEEVQATLGRLLVIEIVVAVVLIGAIGAAAWLLIRRELRPLDRMADAATEIAEGNLTRRIEDSNPQTEVGRLGGALNVMLERIEQAFAARRASENRMRRFLADASHELRTPLTSIRGYAELFRRGADQRPDDLRLSMRRIEDEAARMGVLVEDLLLLAHVDRTRALELAPVDLTTLVRDAAADAGAHASQYPITIEAPDGVVVSGDEARLRQAIGNLVSNAVTHTPPGTAIELQVAQEGRWGVVSVRDQGPGLDRETLEHSFDRFWRGDQSRSRARGGAGLGLAIVDAVARAHGGAVAAENAGTGGARFVLRVPLSQ